MSGFSKSPNELRLLHVLDRPEGMGGDYCNSCYYQDTSSAPENCRYPLSGSDELGCALDEPVDYYIYIEIGSEIDDLTDWGGAYE